MNLKKSIEVVERSEEYKKYMSSNETSYLSLGFLSIGTNEDNWHISYYNKDKDKITTFSVDKGKIVDIKEDDIFKKEETDVLKLEIENVKTTVKEAMDKVKEIIKEKYPSEVIMKELIMIQNLKGFENVWNITLVSQSLNAINIKIDSENLKMKDLKVQSLMDFRQNIENVESKN